MWKSALERSGASIPVNIDADAYAAKLKRRVDNLFPTSAFLARTPSVEASTLSRHLDTIATLLSRNSAVAQRRFSELDSSAIAAGEREAVRQSHEYVRKLVALSPGLGLSALIQSEAAPSEKATQIARRLDAFKRFVELNPETEFLGLDYSKDSEDLARLNTGELQPQQLEMVYSAFKARQRTFALTRDVGLAVDLMTAGYHSAHMIAREPSTKFVQASGLPEVVGLDIHKAALSVAMGVAANVGTVLGAMPMSGSLPGPTGAPSVPVVGGPAADLAPDVLDYLKKIVGFEDLFGRQDYCDCEDCQSILSPSAYFVDLMHFIDVNVRQIIFIGANANHPLDLYQRRPDLWVLPLTCENTDGLVPYLKIVNEILEGYCAKQNALAGDPAVAVYEQLLSVSTRSIRQPFLLPLERLRLYLEFLGAGRAAIARSFGRPQAVVTNCELSLSSVERNLIVTANVTQSFLETIFGMTFVFAGGFADPFASKVLVHGAGISRDDLEALAESDFVTASGAETFQIKAEKASAASVQNDVERVHGISVAILDRMHRMLRLKRHLPWALSELDLMLTHVHTSGLGTDIDGNTLDATARISALAERLLLSASDAIALFSTVPQNPAKLREPSVFDQIFSPPALADPAAPLPDPATRLLHPSFDAAGSPGPADNRLHRIRAGLQLSDEGLATLIRGLAVPLGLNFATANPLDRAFFMSVQNLSLLHRHALVARALAVPVDQLLQLISLVKIGSGFLSGIADSEALFSLHDWWEGSSFTLDELGYLTHGTVIGQGAFPDADALSRILLDEITSEKRLPFAETVFAYLPDVTELQSQAIIDANKSRFERLADGSLRLIPNFQPAIALVVPAGITIAEPDLRKVLMAHHAGTILAPKVAAHLGAVPGLIDVVLKMAGVDLFDPVFATALYAGTIAPLSAAIDKIARLVLLFRNPAFDANALNFILVNQALFGIADFNAVGLESIRELSSYVALADSSSDALFVTKRPAARPDTVRSAFSGFAPAAGFAAVPVATLAAALREEPALVSTLLGRVTLPATPGAALSRLAGAATLARMAGLDGVALERCISDVYGDLSLAADASLGVIRARFPDAADLANRIGPIDSKLLSVRRDALLDSILRQAGTPFADVDELYSYFLIDLKMEGCAQTSPIVCATLSLQHYLGRILMNLEVDQRPIGDPAHVHVSLPAEAAQEWMTWRKTFRLWQANRKVFLFTELYVEPELRDNKTPLFIELESTLFQKEINPDTALDAYAAYLSGFDELTRLSIAGSFHDFDRPSGRDVLHLVGATPSDPPIFYYRRIENATFGETRADRAVNYLPWAKIDVQITSRVASPVVHLGRLFVFWTEFVTKPTNEVSGGASKFIGYRHKMILRYTTLSLDGSWSPPQTLALNDPSVFNLGDGTVADPLDASGLPYYVPQGSKPHTEPVDGYRLSGFLWDRVYPDKNANGLFLMLRAFAAQGFLNFYRKSIGDFGSGPSKDWVWDYFLCSRDDAGARNLYYGTQAKAKMSAYAQTTAIADDRRLNAMDHTDGLFLCTVCMRMGLYQGLIAHLPATADIQIVNGSVTDAVIDCDGDLIMLQRSASVGANYLAKRLNTTLVEPMVTKLFTSGIDGLLATSFQLSLKEKANPIAIVAQIDDRVKSDGIDFKGALGVYFSEIFFHIPHLVGNHLNSLHQFAGAQRWYSFIFDPTADEVTTPPTDRVWRYVQFRNLGVPKLKDILTDKAAIDIYRNDPFNPHAIARLRLSAYQKATVIKYVANLLDWGDSLFTQFTRESINEATMLYVFAAEILGPRPEKIGDCDEPVPPRTYASLKPQLDLGYEFVTEIETYYAIHTGGLKSFASKTKHALGSIAAGTVTGYDLLNGQSESGATNNLSTPFGWKGFRRAGWKLDTKSNAFELGKSSGAAPELAFPSFVFGVLSQYAALFCIPRSEELSKYWDRVEDRLFKIRNCMDINGTRRQPALFAPEIDPMLLVRARAEGISLEDVIGGSNGSLPPYRFTYLIERAKQYAAALQGFGSALLSALEKKDAEELSRLRTVHQQKILKMSANIRQWEIDAVDEGIAQLERQREVIEFRSEFYKALVESGLSRSEQEQQTSRDRASDLQIGSIGLSTLAGVMHLLPQLGSPFSLKWGGVELGKSSISFSEVAAVGSKVFDAKAVKATVHATFERRDESWAHQHDLAAKELPPIDRQIAAAQIRRKIAVRSQEVHDETVDQIEEIWRFHNERFTNLGLYTFLSTSLQRLFREAYGTALGMAKLVEQAYRYERSDDATPLISPSHWEASKAGLLAGEKLLIELQNLEKRYIETNYRTHEVDLPFSLAQINPAALVTLRETGACDFSIPELFFDLAYPGHYNRKIRSVRLTIPCVTGPFTNVGATLTLTASYLRTEPQLGAAGLKSVPLRHTTSIATSTAQNDPGVLEFSFRDERLMPFEGVGAISEWHLQFPKAFRAFDYQTFNDVIVSIAHVADHDDLLRDQVEEASGAVEGAILKVLRTNPLARTFSLRQDISTVFHRILHSAAGTAVKIEIGERHLPIILRGRTVEVVSARLALRTSSGLLPGAAAFSLNGTTFTGFTVDPELGGLHSVTVTPAIPVGLVGEHTLLLQNAGNLALSVPAPGDPSALDEGKLQDILLHVTYRLKT
jgi:hypothetical protein